MIGMMSMRINNEEEKIREAYRNSFSSFRKDNKYDFMEEFFAIQELEEQLYEERKKSANCLKEGFCGRSDWDNCDDDGCGMHILMN